MVGTDGNKSCNFAKAKVFISYTWEEQTLVRQLMEELSAASAEVWIDYSKIRPGDDSPQIISEGLKWCDTLVLIWSDHARKSYWVNIEWQSAIALKKRIIPCILDKTELPSILTCKAFVDFHNFEQGIAQLLSALNLI